MYLRTEVIVKMREEKHMKSNVQYGTCTIDMIYDSRITEIDEGFTKLLGYEVSDVAEGHLTYRSLIVRDINNNGLKSLTAEAVNNGMACAEYFMKCKDGSVTAISCFARSCGSGRIDIMLTKDERERASGSCDTLTGFYNYTAACAEIERLIKRGEKEPHSCIIMRVQNISRMDSEYGTAFTNAVVENAATYINHFYRNKEIKHVPGRISRDTFLVFECGETKERVERIAKWTYEEMQKSYYGRTNGITSGVIVGICHMKDEDINYKEAIYNAGTAMQYALNNNTGIAVYDESMKEYRSFFVNSSTCIIPNERNERIYDYDNRFVSFAVSLLANAHKPESSLDLLLQRIAWKYKFNIIIVAKFEDGHFIRVLNKFQKGKGVITDEEEYVDMNDWDGFMRSFDHSGISEIYDPERDCFSEDDKKFFRDRNIGTSISFLIKKHGEPTGYVSFISEQKNKKLDQNGQNTLIQISKVIEVFFEQRIKDELEEKRLMELSKDFITGLYVQPAFFAKVREYLKEYNPNKSYAIVHSDINNFSFFNSNYGREAGDDILKLFARKLEKMCGENGVCCHIEADSFMYLIVRDTKEEIEREIIDFSSSFRNIDIGTRVLNNIRISSGICYLELDKLNLEDAVYNANLVWKDVKSDRAINYRIYDSDFMREHKNRLNVIGKIRGAIEHGEIVAFLQPKFSMTNMQIVGAEALCRWRNPDGTYKNPIDFIPILEEEGQIVDVDFCILRQVLELLKKWEKDGQKLLPVSVNFSRAHVNAGNFARDIISLAKEYGVDPKYVEIEITESSISSNNEVMLECMQELRDNGFKMEMDEFGTGFSSLNMLIEAPIDIVKIDKSFIDKYEDPVYRAYIDKIGSLIETAKKGIIFEGVENKEQIRFLTSCGYEHAQGFFFSRPIEIKEFEEKYIYNDN